MKRQIKINRLRSLLALCCVLLVSICQQEINRPTANAAKFPLVEFSEDSAQQQSPCSCTDKKDILYRIREINAAIAEYKKQIKLYEAAGTMFTYNEYHDILQVGKIQPVINTVYKAQPAPKANTASASTHPITCSISVNGGSPCLQKAIRAHEASHEVICKIRKNGVADYRDGMTMAAVAQEEINGYLIEISYLKSEYAKFPDSCKQIWYLYYEVKVTGVRTQPKKVGDKSRTTWTINHEYSGTVELDEPLSIPKNPLTKYQTATMTPQQIMAAMSVTIIKWINLPTNLEAFSPMDVSIKDKYETFLNDEGEGGSYEDTTTTKTWDATMPDGSAGFQFDVDSQDKTYNVNIPIKPLGSSLPLKYVEKKVIDRTDFGYGGAPKHEENLSPLKTFSFGSIEIPTVKGLLENGKIQHAANLPLNIIGDTLTFDSGPIPPTEPYTAPWGGKVKNIMVSVYYRLSKLPPGT